MLTGSTNSEKMWNYFKAKGFNDFACAAIIGSADCESGINPVNMEDKYEHILGMTDQTYCDAVDSGRYLNFVNDCVGWGLFQITWHTRKKALLDIAVSKNRSIGDMEVQLEHFMSEMMGSFHGAYNALMNCGGVLEASNIMLLRYECPADQSYSVQQYRASVAQKYYERFSGSITEVKKNMGYLTIKKRSNIKLSEHFCSNEFDCHGSGCCSETIVNEKLLEYLERIREHFGRPVTITSAYRCVVHNRNVGGATGSRHGKGDAADIVVANTSPREVAKYAESIGIKGVGLYETAADGYFTHIDTRDIKSFWYGQACAARSTFGGVPSSGSGSTSVAPVVPAPSNKILYVGSSGSEVRRLQEELSKLGYTVSVDGIFGVQTKNAVMELQSKSGLGVDGIVGYLTQKAIDDAIAKLSQDSSQVLYTVRVNANVLNIRSGAGTNYPINSNIKDRGVYAIIEESAGIGASKWGKLKDGRGWISLDYCEKG